MALIFYFFLFMLRIILLLKHNLYPSSLLFYHVIIFTAFKYQIYSFTDVLTLLLTLNIPNIRDILVTLIIVLFKSTNFYRK